MSRNTIRLPPAGNLRRNQTMCSSTANSQMRTNFNLAASLTFVLSVAFAPYANGGVAEGLAYMKRANWVDAERELRQPAHKGDPVALNAYGDLLRLGFGVTRNPALGWELIYRSAVAGNPEAMTSLGIAWIYGSEGLGDGERNNTLARQWLTRAAEAGDGHAMWELAATEGLGLTEDEQHSFLARAAKARYFAAVTAMLGTLVERKNYQEALEMAIQVAKTPTSMFTGDLLGTTNFIAMALVKDLTLKPYPGIPLNKPLAHAMLVMQSQHPQAKEAFYPDNETVDAYRRAGMKVPKTRAEHLTNEAAKLAASMTKAERLDSASYVRSFNAERDLLEKSATVTK